MAPLLSSFTIFVKHTDILSKNIFILIKLFYSLLFLYQSNIFCYTFRYQDVFHNRGVKNRMIFFAKSADENGKQTTNQEHLHTTALLAKAFGTEIQMPMTAWISGLLHDFGKYSDLFQSVLKGTASHIDHAVCAAVFLYACVLQKKPSYRPVAAVTAAHHSFLRSFDSIMPELSELLHGKGTEFASLEKERLCWSARVRSRAELFSEGFSHLSICQTRKTS